MNSVAEAVYDVSDIARPVDNPSSSLSLTARRVAEAIESATLSTGAELDPRRVLNIIIAAIALVLCAPFMLLIAIAVKLSSPGPVFFTQPRVGLDRRTGDSARWLARRKVDFGGRLFTIYKFRTMTVAGESAGQVWAKPQDARVTRVGSFLRRYRLDELPQFVNVLKGDMNIVGPRPEQPKIFADLRQQIQDYPLRQRVLPGITGWAQINQSYDASVDDVRRKVMYDLEYIRESSASRDFQILMRTVPVMIFKRGAW
jgi:lipopolysaccharide/colanic/teichoic acid biosynthesis glycosyltransferase